MGYCRAALARGCGVSAHLPADDLDEALKQIDLFTSSSPANRASEGSKLARIRFLISRARQSINALPSQYPSALPPGSIDAVMPYLQSINFGLDPGSDLHVAHLIVPLPVNQDRLSRSFLFSDAFRRNLQESVLATINDGRTDIGWMTDGGFDWERGDAWFEFRNATRRGKPFQAVRVYTSGLIAVRDRWTQREAYPSTRFEEFFEASLALSERLLAAYPLPIRHVAISSHLTNMRGVMLGVPGPFGADSTYVMRPPKELADDIDVPSRPRIVAHEQLRSESKELANTQRGILETHYSTTN
jgi:hypothetical protein